MDVFVYVACHCGCRITIGLQSVECFQFCLIASEKLSLFEMFLRIQLIDNQTTTTTTIIEKIYFGFLLTFSFSVFFLCATNRQICSSRGFQE